MDLIIANARVVDFDKGKLVEKDIGIKGGKIYSISSVAISGKNVIDAEGRILSPGFIDIHNHTDYNFNVRGPDAFETAKHLLLMGVTTAVGGNCGSGRVDIKTYLDFITKNGAPNHYMGFVGLRALRESAGNEDVYSPSSDKQIEKMRQLAYSALKSGAVGISLGLEYTPGAELEEVIKVCKVLKQFPGKLVSSHVRYDADRALEGIREMLDLGRSTGIPVQISHINSCACFGFAREALEMMDKATREGTDITADAYPYNAFSTSAGSAVFDEGCVNRWNVDYDSILIAGGQHRGKRCDKKLLEYVRKTEPEVPLIAFVMNEQEVDMVLNHPGIMVCSDGNINRGCGHPRASGTFPKVIHRYTVGKTEEDLIFMLKKMTKYPAQRLGLNQKGEIAEGKDADLVVFDWNSIRDRADFENPTLAPSGIEYVLIDGRIAVEGGKIKAANLGKVL